MKKILAVILLSVLAVATCLETQAGNDTATAATDSKLMPDLLRKYAAWAETDHPILGNGRARALRKQLENANRQPETVEGERHLLQISMNLSQHELQLGNLDAGIKLAESSYKRMKKIKKKHSVPDYVMLMLAYETGLAYMRRGETLNCCAKNSPERCILPIQGSGIHQHPESSKQAIVYFTEVLENSQPDSPLYIKSKWLLNIMYMTIDGYPKAVPASYLIPESVFESKTPFPRFTNIASSMGLDVFDLLGGVIIDDFTRDGYLDIVVSTWDPKQPMHFFRNNQKGGFVDESKESRLNRAVGGFNLIQADYDNDGDLDIFVLRGAWMDMGGQIPNSLLQNDGNGKFSDVTFAAGLGKAHYPTQTAAWADYDNDGLLDLYIGNEHSGGINAPCQLFHNNGDGTFTDLAKEAGVQNLRYAKGVVWGDYDADGYADIYVSNFGYTNRLYHNNHDGTFSDVAQQLGVAEPVASFPAWFWDFNNDGILDLYVSAYDWRRGNLAAVVKNKLGLPGQYEVECLYQGKPEGGFNNVAKEQNLQKMTLPMGANFGDLDNDGYLDFYLGTGYPDYEALMPSVMYHNQGGNGFSDISAAGGFGHLQKGHGVAFADLDNDGDQDVYQQMGGFYPGDKSYNSLFENPGFGNKWLTVSLVGIKSNRSAIGARIHVQVEENGQLRSIFRHVNSGGSFGANPLRQTIGLGKASKIKQLDITWPATGQQQSFNDLKMDQIIEITEGKSSVRLLPLKTHKMVSATSSQK